MLLFSIGLKLKLRSLAQPQVWAVATAHMAITVVVFTGGFMALTYTGLQAFVGLDWLTSMLVAFALSFSSTVFAVKVLEEKEESSALHGRISIGILIMQDIFAIVFLTVSTGKYPSPWALLLFLLPVVRPFLMGLMSRCGHGELLVLLGLPTLETCGVAALLAVVLPLKVALFFLLLTRFKLRARTSLISSLTLANYSEFGLIVGVLAHGKGWMSNDWLVIVAISLSITYVIAAPLNKAAQRIYDRLEKRLNRFEAEQRIPEERPIDPGEADIVVFGMGRVGMGAYDVMRQRHGDRVIGVDLDETTVQQQQEAGRRVIHGDASDSEFWRRIGPGNVRVVLLAMHAHEANLYAARQLADRSFKGLVAATAGSPDQVRELEEAGVKAAFNFYAQAGAGFAEHVISQCEGEQAD